MFFIRDPTKFPHFIHTQKRDPETHLRDPDMFWDYLSLNPESIHQVMILFSDRGTPVGYHHMHGYSGHTFKFVNADGSFHYVQIHLKKVGGAKTFNNEEAGQLAGDNPDYGIQILFEDIEKGIYPEWQIFVVRLIPFFMRHMNSLKLKYVNPLPLFVHIANHDRAAGREVPLQRA